MSDGPVHAFFVSLWERRGDPAAFASEAKTLELIHLMYRAVVAEFDHHPKYDPEMDHKLAWCREIFADLSNTRRDPRQPPRASPDLEGMAQYFLKLGPFAPDYVAPDDEASEMFPI